MALSPVADHQIKGYDSAVFTIYEPFTTFFHHTCIETAHISCQNGSTSTRRKSPVAVDADVVASMAFYNFPRESLMFYLFVSSKVNIISVPNEKQKVVNAAPLQNNSTSTAISITQDRSTYEFSLASKESLKYGAFSKQ